MGEDRESIDWIRVVIHFVVGAIVGGVLGLGLSFAGDGISWPAVIVAALIVGILAAVYGDHFWEGFADWCRWW